MNGLYTSINKSMRNIVISTGAGISAESGVPTFRDADGLWTKYDPMVVSHIDGWNASPSKVIEFKNELRRQFAALDPQPNAAHLALTRLQNEWTDGTVSIITQNIDGLHAKAGSVALEIHGTAIKKFCMKCNDITGYDADIDVNDPCVCGEVSSIRPLTVMFGEMPHHLDKVEALLNDCHIFVAIGTSLNVRPASMFASIALSRGADTWLINKDVPQITFEYNHTIYGNASVEVPRWVDMMLAS